MIPVELPHTCYAKDFLDVDLGRWYHEPIDFVVSQGLMKGMGENRFQPNTSMTRGPAGYGAVPAGRGTCHRRYVSLCRCAGGPLLRRCHRLGLTAMRSPRV
ncbi:MAG: S-layer homology domain-containing protein [Oscillospiraceae bacterium]